MGDLADYYTLLQAARELGVSKSRVEQYVRDGRLKLSGDLAGVRLVLRTDVAALKAGPKKPRGRPRKDDPPPPPADPPKPRRKPQ